MKFRVHKAGYHHVTFSKDGLEFRRYVHELVLTTYVGPCPDGMVCRHLNGDPADNRWPENLLWGTQVENVADMFRHGRGMIGERHYGAKVTEDDVREIRRLAASGVFQDDIASRFGLKQGSVSDIVRRKSWASVT